MAALAKDRLEMVAFHFMTRQLRILERYNGISALTHRNDPA